MLAVARHFSTPSMACGHFSQPGTAHPLTAAYLPGTLHLKTHAKFTPAEKRALISVMQTHCA